MGGIVGQIHKKWLICLFLAVLSDPVFGFSRKEVGGVAFIELIRDFSVTIEEHDACMGVVVCFDGIFFQVMLVAVDMA